MFSPLVKNTQPKLYLLKCHSASAGSFTKIPLTLLYMRKQCFHQILCSALNLETFFPLLKEHQSQPVGDFLDRNQRVCWEKTLCAQATERCYHQGTLPPVPVTLH